MHWPQGYAPPNSDRKEGVLRRKRLEYLDSVAQFYDVPDTERSDDEINMLRQVMTATLVLNFIILFSSSTNPWNFVKKVRNSK